MGIGWTDLCIDRLQVWADKSCLHRFDRFNNKWLGWKNWRASNCWEVLEAWEGSRHIWMNVRNGSLRFLIFEGLQCWLLGIHRWGRTSCAPFSWKLHLDFIRLIGRHGYIGIAYRITYQGQCHGRKISSGTFQRHLAKTASDEKNIKMKTRPFCCKHVPRKPTNLQNTGAHQVHFSSLESKW